MSNNLYRTIPLASAVDIIINNAKEGITTVVEGPTGCGKSHIIENDLRNRFPNHKFILFNFAGIQPGDMSMPCFVDDGGKKTFTSVPRKELGLHLEGEDVIVFMDELFKCHKSVLIEVAELFYKKKYCGHELSENSILVGASNLGIEGFGDNVPGFVSDRIQRIQVRGANHEEWIDNFALPNNLHPTIIAAAKEYPAMFGHFGDHQKAGDNPYIFDPRVPQEGFCTHRSLAHASKVLAANEGRPIDEITHLLAKKLGMRAAMDIMAVHELNSELPDWNDIVKTPEKATVPKSAGACCLLIYTAIQRLDDKTVDPWMKYVQRFKKEAQALFASSILRVEAKNAMISTKKSFLEWAMTNKYLYQ
jgi:hypothetical protein